MLRFIKINDKDLNILKRTMRYLIPYKFKFTLLVLCIIVNFILAMMIPAFSAKVLARIISKNSYKLIYFLLGMFILTILNLLFNVIVSYLKITMEETISLELTKSLFNTILELPFKAFEDISTGGFISRISGDSSIIGNILVNQFLDACMDVVRAIVICVVVFKISVPLTIVVLIGFPLSSYLYLKFGKKIRKENESYLKSTDSFFSKLQQSILGIREIRSLGIKNLIYNDFSQVAVELKSKKIKIGVLGTISSYLSMSIGMVTNIVLFGAGAYLLFNTQLKLENFLAFSAYAAMLSGTLMNISQMNSTIQRSMTSLERVYGLLDSLNYPVNQFGKKIIKQSMGNVEFRDVSFGYNNNNNVLKKINFKVEDNKKIAFVGVSGSGKSTIFNLLMRFYEPKSGKIFLDNIDLKEIDEEFLRRHISIVRQEVFFFNATIKENLLYANSGASMEEICSACKSAYIHDFINSLPNGYETLIEESGTNLSGGQKQRIAIARVILKKSKIILFDEATSSLDNESQYYIKKSIDKLAQTHTVFIIAHRLSTILEADQIIVIEEGKIVGMGKHIDLLKENSSYKLLFEKEINLIQANSF